MELFVKATFWVGLICCICRLMLIASREYPKQTTETLGGDLARLIEGAVFVVWAGIILWGGSR